MSDQLNDLANWTTYLVRASFDYREHCCEFSKFLVQDVPDDYWPDVASQLLELLEDVNYMNDRCCQLVEPYRAHLVKSVAELNLPKPDSHLSWTIWVIEHWLRLVGKVKLVVQLELVSHSNPSDQWFYQKAQEARLNAEQCLSLSRRLMKVAEQFRDFDHYDEIIKRVKIECMGIHYLSNSQRQERDCPITWNALETLCVGKYNRVGKLIADDGSTVRGWRYTKDWPKDRTWQSARKWVNENKDYDFGEPPEEC